MLIKLIRLETRTSKLIFIKLRVINHDGETKINHQPQLCSVYVFFVISIFSNPISFYTIIEGAFKLLGGTSLVFAGINYTFFKNFTIWNK